jgi:hypothetical protein
MVFWAAAAAAVIVFVIALAWWPRERHEDDALEYDDFVELGRAAWIDLRDTDVGDDDRTRLSG